MADKKKVTVKEFADYLFSLNSLTRATETVAETQHRADRTPTGPGLELAGFFDYSQAKRLVILGDKEIAYIHSMSEQAQKRSFDFLTGEETPAIVITRGMSVRISCGNARWKRTFRSSAVRKRPIIRSSTSSPGSMNGWPSRSLCMASCSSSLASA